MALSRKNIEIELGDLTSEQFILLSKKTVENLDWKLSSWTSNALIAYTNFSMRSHSEEVVVKVEENKAIVTSSCVASQLIDWGKNKKNLRQFEEGFAQVRSTVNLEELSDELQNLTDQKPNETEINSYLDPFRERGIIGAFIPKEGYFVTPILMLLNMAVFVIMVLSGVNFLLPENQDLIDWGANYSVLTGEGEYWRLFTACFLHIGVIHLLANMYALVYIGALLEPLLGKWRFLVAYLTTGLVGSLASLWYHDIIISAGASGAIFGMYGVFLALLTTNYIPKTARKTLLTSIGVFVGFNLLNGMKGGIDNAGHMGGLISGMAIGYITYFFLKKDGIKGTKDMILAPALVLILAMGTLGINNGAKDYGVFDENMQEFSRLESQALEFYQLEGSMLDEQYDFLESTALPNWYACKALLTETMELKVKEENKKNLPEMMRYVDLRIRFFELALARFRGDIGDESTTEMNEINRQIESIIAALTEANRK